MLAEIAQKDFDVEKFVHLAIGDDSARNEIVHQMINNPGIMVYYHCYYVISKASKEKPALFYSFWEDITPLLHHKNSYHRDFALDILGNLTKVDDDDRFADVEDDYFDLVNDEKFMTGNNCIKNLGKIYRNKPDLRKKIVTLLLNIDDHSDYTHKQIAVMKFDVLEIMEEFYASVQHPKEIDDFIRNQVKSISPKTRKKAKELVKKFCL